MANLHRRLLEAERTVKDLMNQHASLLRKYDNLQREFDSILTLLIGAARQSQERKWAARNLRIPVTLLDAQGADWAIATDTPKGKPYVEVRAIRHIIPKAGPPPPEPAA